MLYPVSTTTIKTDASGFSLPDFGWGNQRAPMPFPSDSVIEHLALEAKLKYPNRRDAFELHRAEIDGRTAIQYAEAQGTRIRSDAKVALADMGRRDAAPYAAGGGPFALRQLEYILPKVYMEQQREMNALKLFPIDSSVPIGARYYTARLYTAQGEASYISGANTPDVQGGQTALKEERRLMHYTGTNVRMNILEMLSADYAQVSLWEMNAKNAVRAHLQLVNRSAWYGVPELDIRGVLTYPGLATAVSSIPFDGTASGDAVQAEFSQAFAYAPEASGMTFEPTDVVMSPPVWRYASTTRLGSISDITILEFMKKTHPELTFHEPAWELQAVGPASYDGIFFWKRDPDAINLKVGAGLTQLPVQYMGYDQIVPMYGSFGGAHMPYIGNQFLLWVKPPSSSSF